MLCILFQSHTKTQKVNKGGKQKVKRKKTEQDRQENGTYFAEILLEKA